MYDQYWNIDNYQNIYKEIFQKGLKYQTKSRQIQTLLFNLTIGHTMYPKFISMESFYFYNQVGLFNL